MEEVFQSKINKSISPCWRTLGFHQKVYLKSGNREPRPIDGTHTNWRVKVAPMTEPVRRISKCKGHGTQKNIAGHHDWLTKKIVNCRRSRKAKTARF